MYDLTRLVSFNGDLVRRVPAKPFLMDFEREFIGRPGQKMGNSAHYEAVRLHRENRHVRAAQSDLGGRPCAL